MKMRVEGCDFLFHIEGKPLNYCTIQSNYRMAQVKTGISYSVVAMTGPKDLKLAAHYSKIDGEVQKNTSLKFLITFSGWVLLKKLSCGKKLLKLQS